MLSQQRNLIKKKDDDLIKLKENYRLLKIKYNNLINNNEIVNI